MKKNLKIATFASMLLGIHSTAHAAWRAVYTIQSASQFESIGWEADKTAPTQNANVYACWNGLHLKMKERTFLTYKSTSIYKTNDEQLARDCRSNRGSFNEFLFQLQSLGTISTHALPAPNSGSTIYCDRQELLMTVDWDDENSPGRIIGTRTQTVTVACPTSGS